MGNAPQTNTSRLSGVVSYSQRNGANTYSAPADRQLRNDVAELFGRIAESNEVVWTVYDNDTYTDYGQLDLRRLEREHPHAIRLRSASIDLDRATGSGTVTFAADPHTGPETGPEIGTGSGHSSGPVSWTLEVVGLLGEAQANLHWHWSSILDAGTWDIHAPEARLSAEIAAMSAEELELCSVLLISQVLVPPETVPNSKGGFILGGFKGANRAQTLTILAPALALPPTQLRALTELAKSWVGPYTELFDAVTNAHL